MPILLIFQDIPKLIEGVDKLSDRLGIDPRLLKYVWWAIVALLLLQLLTWLKKLLWEEYVKPLRATPDEKRRLARHQQFASDVEGRIRDINSKEEWRDTRFTELEAEVEAEGERQAFSLIPFITRTRSGLRKEKSLSRAIELSRERLIQLEGEPGSGKSVALRFLARSIAYRTARSRSLTHPIPLYLNLKELNRIQDEAVNRNLIERFVHESLTRNANCDIEEYLEEEFKRGMEEGTWFFLFDSFDEIPEVLSSTEADATTRSYADAISDFLGGMNRCRGVVASRHFRGPGQSRWPRFRILPLSEARRLLLVRQALLKPEVEQKIRAHLETTSPDARNMFGNPMLLGLLCDHVGRGNVFPENVHTVLASYLEHRLNRDSERVRRRFQVSPAEVRAGAEAAAFCMTADSGLGLSPTRAQLKLLMARHGVGAGDNIDTLLDALVFIKLARAEGSNGSETFTFAHRRFQEYFATCVVLREPGRVSTRALLTDARWRETAVVMCQSQPSALLSPLAEEARRVIDEIVCALQPAYGDVRGIAARAQADEAELVAVLKGVGAERGDVARWPMLPRERFPWPAGALHVLSLLQEGFRRRPADLPDDIRGDIGDALYVAEMRAMLYDRKCALEVAGVAPEHVLLRLLRNSFAGDSQVLKNIAYRQAGGLVRVPDDVAAAISRAVYELAISGRLHRERFATRAHLARLEKPERFVSALNLLLAVPNVDLLLQAGLAVLLGAGAWSSGVLTSVWWFQPGVCAALLISHLCLRAIFTTSANFDRNWAWMYVLVSRWLLVTFSLLFIILAYDLGRQRLLYFSLGSIYVWLWVPSAIYAAKRGVCASWQWWPAMPVLPVLIFLKGALKRWKWPRWKWPRWKWPRLTDLVAWGLLVGAIVFAVVSLLIVGIQPTLQVEESSPPPEIALIIAVLFFMIFCVCVLCPLLIIGFKDWLRWQRGRGTYSKHMTWLEFSNELAAYNNSRYLLRFVKAVRARGLLSASREADELLEKLSLAAECAKTTAPPPLSKSSTPNSLSLIWKQLKSFLREMTPELYLFGVSLSRQRTPAPRNLEGFDEWYAQTLGGRPQGFGLESAEMLDELVLLLEQVRANRSDWPADDPTGAADSIMSVVIRV